MEYSLEKALIGDWASLVHTLLVGVLSYFGLIFVLRISGKRTLSKWNSFDFAVTIALGSILASALLSKGVSVLQALLATALIVGLQFIMTWLSVHTEVVESLIKSEPTLLLFKGRILEDVLIEKRVSRRELLAAIRLNGNDCIEDIDAVVLENEGTFSVIKNVDVNRATALSGVRGAKERILSA